MNLNDICLKQKKIIVIYNLKQQLFNFAENFFFSPHSNKNSYFGKNLQEIFDDITNLYNETYNHVPYIFKSDKRDIIFTLYTESDRLIGTLALFYREKQNMKYREIAMMIISKEMRDKRLQRCLAIPILEKSYSSLNSGVPVYISVRVQNAKSQHLIEEIKNTSNNSKLEPCGFLPYYILDCGIDGDYYIECGIFYEVWEIEKKKKIILPKALKEFRICNKKFNSRVRTKFVKCSKFIFNPLNVIIYSLEFSNNKIKTSKNNKFQYFDSNEMDRRVIHLIKINSLDFLADLLYEKNLFSVNICLKCSYEDNRRSIDSNLLIIQKLNENGFVPSAIFDVLDNNLRVSAIQFVKWENIKFQQKIEVLNKNKGLLKNFLHDIYIQKQMVTVLDELFIIRSKSKTINEISK